MARTSSLRLLPIVLAAALLLALTGCKRKASDELDFGSLTNSVYENKYLGITVALPRTWSVQDPEAQRQIMDRGRKLVTGDDQNLKAAIKASEMQSVNLFFAFKYPRGSAVDHNPAIMAVAERVRDLPGIQRGKDYLFHARKTIESSKVHATFPKEIYTEQLGGVDFDVMEMEMSVGKNTVKEKYYAALRKGYAISFIQVYVTEEEAAFERTVLDTMKFK